MLRQSCVLLALASALAVPAALAVTPQTAQRVIERVEALPVPGPRSSAFERWLHDTALMAAAGCWHGTAMTQPAPSVLRRGFSRSGTYQAPDDRQTEALCQALATEGIQPVCTHAFAVVPGLRPDPTWMREYLQVSENWQQTRVQGGLYCQLTPHSGPQQLFATPLQLTWRQPPAMGTLNTAQGPRRVQMGQALISVPDAPGPTGAAFMQPMTAVVVPQR